MSTAIAGFLFSEIPSDRHDALKFIVLMELAPHAD